MCVAMTRGRKSLFLSSVRDRMVNGEMQSLRPSRFLKEVPPELSRTSRRRGAVTKTDDDGAHSSGWSVTPIPKRSPAWSGRVRHDLYGNGAVRRIAGQGMKARAVVRFDDGVEREFMLSKVWG